MVSYVLEGGKGGCVSVAGTKLGHPIQRGGTEEIIQSYDD